MTDAKSKANLDAAIFQRLHPRAYLERFLAEGFRTDGRATDECRDVTVNVGSISTAEGSALVRLGNTTVVCGVKAEIAEPELDRPNDGFIVPNIDLPAICSPKFKPGPPTEEAQALSDSLHTTLCTAASILPLSALCIHPGKAVWVLYVDAVCINYDGNVFDAAVMAMGAALRNARIPKAEYDEETGQTLCARNESIALPLRNMPLSLSFGVFDSTTILPDPNAFEEPLLDSTVTITTISGSGQEERLLSATHIGLAPPDALSRCVERAKSHIAELRTQIEHLR